MKTRAELLAELDEKSRKNKTIDDLSENLLQLGEAPGQGYNPYDNPGISKEIHDAADIVARRRPGRLNKKRR